MKKNMLLLAALICFGLGCQTQCNPHTHNHAHDENGNHIPPETSALEPLVYTMYSDRTELFVEFKPLIVGQESRFAAHFTLLGDYFKAMEKGSVSLSLVHADGHVIQSVKADSAEVPGIFRLRLTPEHPGIYNLHFDIQTDSYTDKIVIEKVEVFADQKIALEKQAIVEVGGNAITYTKEQAWKVEFASAIARKQPFSEVVRTSGQILAAPGDEVVVTAQISGVVSFIGKNMIVGSPVEAGAGLFTLSSTEIVTGNLDAAYKQAENDVAVTRKQYERATELVKDQIISEKEFLEAKLRLENAEAQLESATISKNFTNHKKAVTTPISGYLKNVFVENGAYVQAGQPLATVSKNKRLLLRADVSQKYFPKLASFTSANFRSTDGEQVFSTKDLNGKIVSTGKSASAGSPFLSIFFEIDNKGSFISGSVVEVFLQSGATPALLIPTSALLEEQGLYYVFVQSEGETFQKRELKIGSTDGINVQVLSGISEGERIVTKGAYQIKLAAASGTMPAHGHEH